MAGGLRERKKQELRDRLSRTTVVLAKERGLANVRVDDIVERVGVSRRTFSNYFASKEEAIADRHVQRTREAALALRDRPADEPLWDAVATVLIEPYVRFRRQDRQDRDSLIAVLSEPDAQLAIAQGSRVAVTEFAEAIAERIGTDPDTDIYPRLVANTALSTQLLSLDFWLHAESSLDPLTVMREAFERLGSGFAERS